MSNVSVRTRDEQADMVIVGNGIAGLTAAIEARRLAPELHITIISEQSYPTINTPALTQFIIGTLEREQLLAYPGDTERRHNIRVLHGRVEEIVARGNYVRLASGSIVSYRVLLLATGGVARGLPTHLPGRNLDGVLTLHRLPHYLDLRRRLNEVEDAVVIGGGVHAAETVACLLRMNITTSWLLRSKTCLVRELDERASELVIRHIEQLGASVYTETEVLGMVGSVGAVAGVVTNRQQMLPCQLVLACTGTKPATLLAERCDLPMLYERERGIYVDHRLRTRVAGIYAAGDVAALPRTQTERYEAQAQWYAAVVQGATAAATMLGHPVPRGNPFGAPWHATRLGNLSMLTVGNPLERVEGSMMLNAHYKGTYRRLSLLDDRLIGYISLGQAQDDGQAMKRLIDEGHSVRPIIDALLKGRFEAHTFFLTHAQQAYSLIP